MEEVKSRTVSALAGMVFFHVFVSAIFTFFFFYLLVTFVPEESALIASTILGVLFIFWMTGATAFNTAVKDYNMVRFGHQKQMLYKGFLSGAIAQLPGAVLLIFFLAGNNETLGVIYRLLYNSSLWFLSFASENVFFYILPLLIFIVASGVGYLLGTFRARKNTSLGSK